MSDAGFWVIHRRRCYGPFDYQFSGDLDGIEFLYQGEKYGECCSSEEFFADLHPYRLPQRVSEAATVVTGTVIRCIFLGIPAADRFAQIAEQLRQAGLDRVSPAGTLKPCNSSNYWRLSSSGGLLCSWQFLQAMTHDFGHSG